MQPVRIKNVDLVRIGAQRRETGGVPGHIKRRADAFRLVQLDLRGRNLRLAVGAGGCLLLAIFRFLLFTFLESLESPLLGRKQEFWKGFVAQRGKNKKDDQGGDCDRYNVEQSPQVFPAGASGIIKDWLRHWGNSRSIVCCGE